MTVADNRTGEQIVQFSDETRSFVTRQIAGETLIMPVAGRVMDLESIYVLNEVGSRIWELVGSPTTLSHVTDTIAREFAVTREQAAIDVSEFLGLLSARGLVRQIRSSV
jgi:hypothetical protein